MIEFVAFRTKMFAHRKQDKKLEDKRCKGTKKYVVAESLTFDDYKTCLFDGKTICREQRLFGNEKHVVHMVNNHKITLNRDEDIRKIQADRIVTSARDYSA